MPNENTFLYIKPEYDDLAISYLVLTESIKDAAKGLGYNVVSVEGNDATPENIWSAIETHDPYYVLHSGHGCPQLTTGVHLSDVFYISPGCDGHYHDEPMISMLKGRVVYLLSCFCGMELAPEIAKNNGACLAYHDELVWVINSDLPPINDDFAKSFFECFNSVMIKLLEGKPLTTVISEVRALYDSWINAWENWIDDNPEADPEKMSRAIMSIQLLEHDRNILVGYVGGDMPEPPLQTEKSNILVPIGFVAGLGLMWKKIM